MGFFTSPSSISNFLMQFIIPSIDISGAIGDLNVDSNMVLLGAAGLVVLILVLIATVLVVVIAFFLLRRRRR